MWTRSEIKAKAKAAYKDNYWKSVLVALLITLFIGSASSGVASTAVTGAGGPEGSAAAVSGASVTQTVVEGAATSVPLSETEMQALGVVIPLVLLAFVALIALLFAMEALLVNPLEVGARRFFVQNLHSQAQVREVAYAFDHGYRNTVKTLFARDMRVIGWGLLLVVPGIVKSYEYRMVPYLLAENPQLGTKEAFALSKRLMAGNKWRTFVLDLSFLGWHLLGLLTLGAVELLVAAPYAAQTEAELYEQLRYGDGMPELAAPHEA